MKMRLEILTLILTCLAGTAVGHGYLAEPPGRASAWRYGFDTPPDYDDSQCYCGGVTYQYSQMGGKCGLCGDPWDQQPRDHEVGGIYATGTIVRHYSQGQVIHTSADVVANHMGHFEFKICANNDVTVEATQDCLDLTPLYAVNRNDWHLNIGDTVGFVDFDLQLPADLTCSQCVLQWRYVAANNWGICENGTGADGCGPQEEYRSCADVSISPAQLVESPDYSPESVVEQLQALEKMSVGLKTHSEMRSSRNQEPGEELKSETDQVEESDGERRYGKEERYDVHGE